MSRAKLMGRFVALLLLAAACSPAHARCTAQIISGPVKVRPYGPLLAPNASRLLCARNEYCSFQVVITADHQDCTNVDVEVSSPRSGDRSIPAQNIVIYRQGWVNVFYRSSEQGAVGEWPDPLIPKFDPDYGEKRNAFPTDIRLISPAYKKYRIEDGHAVPGLRGTGTAVSGGRYAAEHDRQFVVQVVRGGKTGTATFRWWSRPGLLLPSAEMLTSSAPVPLADGVTVSFGGAGNDDDFLAGDEFWVFAGPARRQPVWVDVLIPADATAGIYRGEIRVTAARTAPIHLPIEIEVLNFAVPSTSTLANNFGMYWLGVCAAHYGTECDDKRLVEMGRLYAQAALRNGITLGGADTLLRYDFPAGAPIPKADYARFDAVVGSLMDGQGTPRGARWTSLPLFYFTQYTALQNQQILCDFAQHLRGRGWLGRSYLYLFDEPHRAQQFQELAARARLAAAVVPELPRLATTPLNHDLFGLVTRWAPVVNQLAPKEITLRQWWRNRRFPRRGEYEERLRAGDTLWWYQSCMSHGCGGAGTSPDHDNWPSYMVDILGAANRVFGLLSAVTYRVSGMLYWDVAYAHHHEAGAQARTMDPWESLYYFGGNGDGSLFYPGRPEQIGGTRHIPIESLRLKMIRDSLTDADYADLLKKLGEEEYLRQEVSRVIQNASRWNADPQAWVELRQRLARRIHERTAGMSAPHR